MSSVSRLILYPIAPAGRARLVDAYSPNARVLRVRRLRGGLGASTQVLDIEHTGGRREKVVLRMYLPGRETLTPERARREFHTIQLVQAAGVPSPRPLFLDAEGAYLGEPAMLLSYLPGRSVYQPRDARVWTEELARAMHSIHAITPERFDLTWLPRRGKQEIGDELEAMRKKAAAHEDGIAREAWEMLSQSLERIVWLEPCLIHEDFWPGNTVWFRNRLAGVIDWANACVGDPRLDPAQCAIDSHLVNSREVSEALRTTYAGLADGGVPDQWFFDLYVGLRGLFEYKIWLIGYHDAGLTFVTEELAGIRVRDFIRRAMDEGARRAA